MFKILINNILICQQQILNNNNNKNIENNNEKIKFGIVFLNRFLIYWKRNKQIKNLNIF